MNYKKISSILFAKPEPVKVELSLIGDLQEALKVGAALHKKMDGKVRDAISVLSAYEKAHDELMRDKAYIDEYVGKIKNFKIKIEAEAKALGLDPSEIQEYKKINDSASLLESMRKSIDNLPNTEM